MNSQPVIMPHPQLSVVNALLCAASLPTSDLTTAHCHDFFFAGPNDSPIGLVGLEMLGAVALLRSLVVVPGGRNTGLGSALVRHAEDHARRNGVRDLYLLTTTAAGFFAKRGYQHVARAGAPAAIMATREFAGICPASSAFMCKQL
jgi:amino-acid N-acetyltransferase